MCVCGGGTFRPYPNPSSDLGAKPFQNFTSINVSSCVWLVATFGQGGSGVVQAGDDEALTLGADGAIRMGTQEGRMLG